MQTIICFTNGCSQGNPGPAGIGVHIVNERNEVLYEMSESIGNSTETVAEYCAVARCLQRLEQEFDDEAKDMKFEIRLSDAQVQQHLDHKLPVTDMSLVMYFMQIHNLRVSSFTNLTYTLVKLKSNNKASQLATDAIRRGK
jgi:ribonuclease HI